MKPLARIRKRPFISIGAAVLAGFLIGSLRKSGKKSSTDQDDKFSVTSMVGTELKKLAARRAVGFISKYVDQEIIPRLKKRRSESSQESDQD